jgi:hypothetical protein
VKEWESSGKEEEETAASSSYKTIFCLLISTVAIFI